MSKKNAALARAPAEPQCKLTYSQIHIIADCRLQGGFGRGQYHARECDFEFYDDGSVVIMMKSTKGSKQRPFAQYTSGQWYGQGEMTEE